jgi:hypothetical protein
MDYMICPKCGSKNLADHTVCLRCKARLDPTLHMRRDTSSIFSGSLMSKSVTISSPLTITEARQRLGALLATDPVIPGSGRLGWMNERHYVGGFDGTALWLLGPSGYRKQSLRTDGHLEEEGNGVALKLVLRPENSAVGLIVIGLFICLPMIVTRSFCMLPVSLFFAVFFYVGLLMHFFTEAGIIEDLLRSALSKRNEKVQQEGAMRIS